MIGIDLYSSSDNTVVNNLISDNIKHGIYIPSTSNRNLIYNNSFYYNNGAGDTYDASHVQAYDSGHNYWNNSAYGNYWHDWANNNDTNDQNPQDGIVDWPYVLDGGTAKDYYPLAEPSVPIPELSWMVLVALLGAIVIIVRKKH
jgi:parallel beta-helix repeat protein